MYQRSHIVEGTIFNNSFNLTLILKKMKLCSVMSIDKKKLITVITLCDDFTFRTFYSFCFGMKRREIEYIYAIEQCFQTILRYINFQFSCHLLNFIKKKK